jgi:tRNA(Ile)-lysidine synthase
VEKGATRDALRWRAALRLSLPVPGGVVVAVSAGADSTALALRLADARVRPLRLLHVQHGFRPDAAARERSAVEELARRIEAPLDVVALRPPDPGAGRPRVAEAWARARRYEALLDAARRHELRTIATGHHAADRRESQLLLLARGGGLAALRGMAPLRRLAERWLWRPLLAEEPDALRDWLRARGVAWCEDASNGDVRLARNRLRHVVLPQLVAAGDPLASRLDRLAALATRALERVEARAAALLAEAHPTAARGLLLLPRARVAVWPAALLPALLDEAARAVGAAASPRHRRVELETLARWLASATSKGTRALGSLALQLSRDWIGVAAPDGGFAWRVTTRGDDGTGGEPEVAPPAARLSARFAASSQPLVRCLATGDHPKRVAARLPWFERGSWPVVEIGGAIAWIPGLEPPPRPPAGATLELQFDGLPDLARRETGRAERSARPA